MSELLALEEEPGRTCGHDECQHGGCKGPTIDKASELTRQTDQISQGLICLDLV